LDKPDPLYEAARTYLPTPERICLQAIITSALEKYYPASLSSPHPQHDRSQPQNVRLDFRVSAKQIVILFTRSAAQLQASSHCKTALSPASQSLLATDSSTQPIHSVDMMFDVRSAAGTPAELAFSGFAFVFTDRIVPADRDDRYVFAAAVRQRILRAQG
jgi:hypothetical protein